ncbi:hypothetical protein LWI28_002518 [Acer negundo]|uniref:Uncharacterized protein n=1 Tax=Acer negundo TaxID=4023 RepID=A0AAD5J442_ACENE|nr:hypothetical protein LWI28_002518 [Acer negundo]
MYKIFVAPGTVTGVDIARHHLAACRTLPQKLHPGSSLSTSSVGCTVSKCDVDIDKAIQEFHEKVNAKNMQRLQKDNELKKAKQQFRRRREYPEFH